MNNTAYTSGPDINLDREAVYEPDGTRLTEARARLVAEETLRTVRGRPSLTAAGEHSPRISFRLPADERARAERLARKEGTTVSALARRALEDYLAGHPRG